MALAAALLVAGCGSDSAGLDKVTVKGDKSPTVSVDENFKATKTTTKVVKKGKGDAVAEGDAVTLDYVAVNGRTGKTFDSSFKSGSPLTTTLKSGSVLPGFVKGLKGQKVGSRVLIAIPPKDGFGAANKQLGLKASDTMVFLMDIVKSASVPEAAEGKAKKLPDTLPKLTLDDKKHPAKFVKTDTTEGKATKMSTHVAIQGEGPAIKAGQSLTIQYVGQTYPAGDIFDESWSREPATFQIGAGKLIKCWDESLVGQKVGSRVVLVCPADVAYGKEGSGDKIKPGDTLIFAVDLLAAF
ncbi:MAG: FKBP-type peptidyl-prolyl cis-trans isomerase [Actinomycetota bacterium]|nr:FKBP-type peptidyl-prolyl cis-trans isomerase [Actinomycetota bacterium]